jgi:hypothetical protein
VPQLAQDVERPSANFPNYSQFAAFVFPFFRRSPQTGVFSAFMTAFRKLSPPSVHKTPVRRMCEQLLDSWPGSLALGSAAEARDSRARKARHYAMKE